VSYSYNSPNPPFPGYPAVSPAAAPVPAGPLRAQFLILFVALVILSIPAIWLFVPNIYIQVAGHQTQGVETIVADCGSDDGSDDQQAATLFIDDQGQFHEIPANGTCTNFYTEGESVPVWYLPNNPSSTYILNGVSIFLYIFLILWLVAAVAALIFFARTTLRLIRASIQTGELARLWRVALLCLLVLAPLLLVVKLLPPGQPNASGSNYRPGAAVPIDGRWAVTVQGGHPVQVGLSAAPSDGDICLELDITLRNITTQTLAFNTDQFALYDAQAKAIIDTCPLQTTGLSSIENMNPGEMTSGIVAYQVPISQQPVYLAFQPDPDNAPSVARSFWRIQVTQAGRNHQPGETVSVDTLWDVTIKSVRTNPPNVVASPGPNATCLALDVVLRNTSGVSLDESADQFSLYDTEGVAIHEPCVLNAPEFTGRAAPGSTTEAALGFDVPAGESHARLAFQAKDCTQNCQQAIWDINIGG
jgi:hypothetical protein